MNNPIAVFEHLRELYLRYLDSPLAIRYEVLRDERRRLLDQDRRMWRQPLIEPTPVYPACDGDFREVMRELLNGHGAVGWLAISRTSSTPLSFRIDARHTSINAKRFRRVLVEHRDLVVTTATGREKRSVFLFRFWRRC